MKDKKKFNWLGRQSLDFYLPEYNIAIEYQGNEHFEYISIFHNKEGFEIQNERDRRKKKLCEENNIKLLFFTFDTQREYFLGDRIYHNINEFDFLKK